MNKRHMRSLLAVILLVGPVCGQIQSLSTTGDGSVVYFDTALPRQGTGEPSQGRIVADDGTILVTIPLLYPPQLHLLKDGKDVWAGNPSGNASIDANAEVVVYEAGLGSIALCHIREQRCETLATLAGISFSPVV